MSAKRTAVYPPNPLVTRGRACKISSDASGDKLVYTNEKAVVIRDIRNLSESIVHTSHLAAPTAARLSPSGYYCASADAAGTLRVWDVAGTEQIVKLETKGALSGRINDVAWDGESKRLIVVGEGRESFGRALMLEGGSSCGEIIGHSKAVNAVAVRGKRPFRAATGGDDGVISFMTGVPYKFSKTLKSHTSFINDLAFSPDGDLLASVGGDGKVFLYDGAEGEIKASAGDKSSGSLYSLSFAPDSKSLATSSANSVVQLYDASSLAPTTMFNLSSASDATSSQQLGVTYLTPSTLASVSLSGVINLLDARAPDQTSYLYGPTKGITACGVSSAAESADSERTFWAGSFDGGVKSFVDGQDACWEDVRGEGHKGQIVGFAARKDGGVATTAWDDSVKEVTPSVGFICSSVPTPSQPSSIASLLSQDLVAVAAGESVDLLQAGKKIASKTFQGERVLSVALVEAASGPLLAVGFEANKVHVYAVSATSISEAPEVEFKESRNPVYALAFSPDGSLLAAGESGGKIQVFDVGAKSVKISGRWASHTGRITALRWSADGQHCASSSLDTNVFVWSVARPMRNIKIPNAHAASVAGVEWLSTNRLVSAGADGCAKVWEVTFHA